jgi:queuine tRNA-ribosyltransferase
LKIENFMFKIIKKSEISNARLGIIKTSRGPIETPFFMPDATYGQVKNLTSQDLINLGLKCFVVNALHLFLRPGLKLIKRAGGLHDFIGWPKPILADSGGYQVFSLIYRSRALLGRARDKNGLNGEIIDAEVVFRSPLNGGWVKLTPEQSIKIQFELGAEMMVCLDDCPPNDYNDIKLEIAVKRTIAWAKRCWQEYQRQIASRRLSENRRPLIIAVIQGGNNLALREYCARELLKIGFSGFGFGARHVDVAGNFLSSALEFTARRISDDKLRFGLGIGSPEDIIKAVKVGYDMFDCVIPTREGRHGRLFLWGRRKSCLAGKNFYKTINITNAKFAKDFLPINVNSNLPELRSYSRAYLHYLFKMREPLALRLASLNNLEFYLIMVDEIRRLIKNGKF